MSENQDFSILVKKRGSIKRRLTSFEKYLNNVLEKVNNHIVLKQHELIELESKIEKIQDVSTQFNSIQDEIEILDECTEEQFLERELFESKFDSLISIAKGLLSLSRELEIEKLGSDSSSNSNLDDHKSERLSQKSKKSSAKVSSSPNAINTILKKKRVELPPIKLPVFKGSYESWPEFRDTFLSLIDSRDDLDDTQKFHYLRLNLEDKAKQTIESISFQAKNYKIAWNLLVETFENKNLLVYNHLKKLLNIEYISPPSAAGLRNLNNEILKHLNSLKELGLPTDTWDVLIIFLMCEKLDKRTEQAWEESNKGNIFPTLESFKLFLKSRADMLEKLENRENVKERTAVSKGNKGISYKNKLSQKTFSVFDVKCSLCKKDHFLSNCGDFLKLSVSKRVEHCKNARLCLNCMKANHVSKDCHSSSCKKCHMRHHTLLHYERSEQGKIQTNNNHVNNSDNKQSASANIANSFPNTGNIENSILSSPSTSSGCYFLQSHEVLLSTAIVNILDNVGKPHQIRVLLDSGSQSNFISAKTCEQLGLLKQNVNISVVGVTQVSSNINYKCSVQLKSLYNDFQLNISCLVIPHISDQLPSFPVNKVFLEIPKNILLADSKFYTPGSIDVLLGAEVFYNLLCMGQINLGKNKPILQKTVFGWIVSGCVSGYYNLEKSCCALSVIDVQQQLEKFWELEESAKPEVRVSKDEETCELLFQKTTSRSERNEFVVNLPLRQPPEVLGDSSKIAMTRFLNLERKLQHNSTLRELYIEFMNEYNRLGHMRLLENFSPEKKYYFLPHHGVLRENSVTTKLRVVFDGSCASDNGVSLNDILLVGPTIQDELINIMLRFRQYPIVMCADIEKMYRMVKVSDQYWPLQCIFWRTSPNEEIKVYTLTTVTYGTASAPFLAVRCLKQLAEDCRKDDPEVSKHISRDFYVDDYISGAWSVEEATKLAVSVSSVLKSGSFNLRKWYSNNADLLAKIHTENTQSENFLMGEKTNTKLLGLLWCSNSDVLSYSIKDIPTATITKRLILSQISQIYDPLGLIGPCIVIAKLILQNLWTLKLNWDESVPSELATRWIKFRKELSILNQLEIPRHCLCQNPVDIQLHGFSDSSGIAYGCAIYMRSEDSKGNVNVSLLCAKSKVAPLKSQTVNRLELCGAVLLAQLMNRVNSALSCDISKIFLWSDSLVVLCWIKQSPHKLQQFVANRVLNIQTLTNMNNWHHVSTISNPADLISRGVFPRKLISCSLWWKGPNWLCDNETSWPNNKIYALKSLPDVIDETKVFNSNVENNFPFDRFSDFKFLKRTFAYIKRFINNCKSKSRLVGILSLQELNDSEMALVKIAQYESFKNEIIKLQSDSSVKSLTIQRLNPFIDSKGIIRVGGRLNNSVYNYNKCHPILLSGKHHFSKFIMSHEHKLLFHAGAQHLLASIRERFWITQGRVLAKQTIRECVTCQRFKPSSVQPIMGSLPKDRVNPSPPFHITGIDYAGPFNILDKKGRGSKIHKCYIALFVCFTTRAIHLELVSDLTSEGFIAALRRFVSRRGKPAKIYSDNGTTFVGAKAELESFTRFVAENESLIRTQFSNDGIDWHFIPVQSPHFGGLWEAGVKSSKFHIKRVLRNAHLTFEEFTTVLHQIEAILNSRPITPLSSDPNDFDVLTPGHFLIGRRLTSVPDQNYSAINDNRLSRYQYLQKLQGNFWCRWVKEFVSELQTRVKWTKSRGELTPNTLVLIREDNLPPMQWRLGRIESVYPGSDGHSRVADVKTARGVIKRSFSKLCPLLPDNTSEDTTFSIWKNESSSSRGGHVGDFCN